MTWSKNWRISSNISGSTGPILAIFTPYESASRANDGTVSYFPICEGTLSWQPNNIAKMYQRRLIPLAFGELVLENELKYHGLAVRSGYDACILCESS